MTYTNNPAINKGINRWVAVTLAIQVFSSIRFFAKLDSRVAYLEEQMNKWDRFTMQDWQVLEQKVEFYMTTIAEMKADIKEIKSDIKQLH